MPYCRFCHCEKPFIKAHIIPKQLYKLLSTDNDVPQLHTVGKDRYKQCQNGIYDSFILCKECDNEIGKLDNYGQDFLLNRLQDTDSEICKIDTFDYEKLKLFFLSVLWRSEITSHPFFAQVKIGDYWENKLRKMILTKNAGDKDDFSVIIFKYYGEFSEIMQNPMKLKLSNGVNYYRFRLPNYGFLIKVDKRNFLSELESFILSRHQPLLIRLSKYTDSKDFKTISKIYA